MDTRNQFLFYIETFNKMKYFAVFLVVLIDLETVVIAQGVHFGMGRPGLIAQGGQLSTHGLISEGCLISQGDLISRGGHISQGGQFGIRPQGVRRGPQSHGKHHYFKFFGRCPTA